MAATSATWQVTRIPLGDTLAMEAAEGSTASGNSSTFQLKGGAYLVEVIASTFGTVTLQRLGPDGSTWLTALTAFSANGIATQNLARGSYRFALA